MGRSGADLVVARDGTGDFRTVQAALDALPAALGSRTRIVLVRRGVYREKLYVTKSRLAIVGEDRAATRIEWSELRREWRKTHPDDWGAAVVNIGDDVSDLVIANLTIRNDYGSRVNPAEHDHQFALRSGGRSTRLALLHADLLSDGGDTVSLWNTVSGQSYLARCTFSGWVDAVCPRGSSFITNSRFFARSPTACLWHDGSKDRDHRLVVRASRFDGVPGFALGRFNRDGAFYLLDDAFSAEMADRPIYPASAPETYGWEPRTYFSGCLADDGPRPWLADNLRDADFSPSPGEITPEWTFCGQWDPEASVPAVLPFAALPRPHDGARDVPLFGARLSWAPARQATAYEVRLGAANGGEPRLVARLTGTTYDTGPLLPGTAYSWRVDAIGPGGSVPGETWTFTTARQATRIALAGDSTVTDEQGWGLGFAARLREGLVSLNRSRGGRSTRSYRSEGLWSAVLAGKPDWVLIQLGHNDMPGKGLERETDVETTYPENLARMVDEARAAGVSPVLVTPLTRRRLDAQGCVRSDLVAYADAMRTVAAGRRVPLIDLHARSIEAIERMTRTEVAALGFLKDDGTPDLTHLSARGGGLFGGLVAEELARAVPALAPGIRSSASGVVERSADRPHGIEGVRSLRPLLDRDGAFFASGEALRVASNLLLYQRANGGWPKNLDMTAPVEGAARERLLRERASADTTDTTIDNGATVTQIRFLARVVAATPKSDARLVEAALAGLDFLLAAEYPRGGWPQFFPLRSDYSRHVTFNDDAMAGVMSLLRDVATGAPPFAFVDAARRSRAAAALDRGVAVILRSQVVVAGRRTGWCAQHDAVTLAPRAARAFEPVALATAESVGVVELLMSLPRPSPEVVEAVDAAVAWLGRSRIEGLRVERRAAPGLPGGADVVATPDPEAPGVWARFYDVASNRPLFCGRDGVVRGRLAEIEHERRVGYAWYGTWPRRLLERDYPAWKAEHP